MTSKQAFTPERTGKDRRKAIDHRNPSLQSWMRDFWNRYFSDNPDKERRRLNERRQNGRRPLHA